MSKKSKKKNNEEKKLKLGIDSRTRRLLVKINQEQVVYYNEPDGNEELSKRVDHLIELKKQINAIKDSDDSLTVTMRENLSVEFDKAMKEKNEWLTKYCEDKGYLKSFFENILSIDNKQFEVFAAPHDKDVFWDNFFQSHPEDYHIHIVVLGKLNNATKKRRIFRISDVLDMLHIRYDEKRDLSVLDMGAIQVCKHIADSIQYLLHWTALSEEEGKFIYDRDVLVTNDEDAADEYLSMTPELSKTHLERMNAVEASKYAEAFTNQGKALVSFKDAFLNVGLPLWFWHSSQGKKTVMNVFENAYIEGLEQGAALTHIGRICLYIYGEYDLGKTTAVEHLCDYLNVPRDAVFEAHNGYGKYDGLNAKHQMLVADDTGLTDVLKIADEKVAILPQRNRGKALFSGNLLIVTSNKKPEDFFHKTKEDKHGNVLTDKDGLPRVDEEYESRISRFVFIKAGKDGTLTIEKPCTRGSRLEKAFERHQVVKELVRIMEESTKEYCSFEQVTSDEILKYPSRDIALRCRLDLDFKSFVDRHTSLFGDNVDLYYEAYRDDTPALLGEDNIEAVFYDNVSVVSL